MRISAITLSCLLAVSAAGCSHNNLASVVERHEGKTAKQLGLPATLWCSDFADKARIEAGLTPVKSRRAIDQSKNAIRLAKPERGALMISARPGGNHVDVVLAVNELFVEVAGGNVRGRVTRRHLPIQAGRFYRAV